MWLLPLVLIGIGVATFINHKNTVTPAQSAPKDKVLAGPMEFSSGDVVQITLRPLSQGIPLSGTLTPAQQATVKTSVGGQVQSVRVREGQTVRQGDVIAELETTTASSRLESALADQAERRARFEIAARNRDTNQKLLQQSFISQNAFDQLQSTYQGAAAALHWADAQVELARQAIADAVVRAPLAGIVAKRLVQNGERLTADTPVVQLVNLKQLELEATVPVSEVARIQVGHAVRFTVDGFGERPFTGKVARINPQAEPGSRAIKVFVGVPNAEERLRGGMFAQGAVLVSQSANALTVPLSAVVEEAGQSYVYAITSGTIAKLAVQLGISDDTNGLAEVRNGLAAGTTVVKVRMPGLKVGTPAVVVRPSVAS